jgi:hypothetical protein
VRFLRAKPPWACALAALSAAACSSNEDAVEGGTSTGGATATGGASGSGGVPLAWSGGAATGGGLATGGSSTGGNSTGGQAGSGGVSSGGASSGGASTSCTPEPNCEPAPPNTGDFHEDCVARINQFRACLCLEPLLRNTEGEECAREQAQYDFEEDSAHAGIRAEICSPQALNNAAQNECPGYPSLESTIGLCNQQMFDEGLCEEFSVCGHYLNMMNEDAQSVSCGYYETPAGDVWMIENFYF